MLRIAYNKVSRNIEYLNGRLIDDRPTTTGHPAFHLAARAYKKFSKGASRLWKAAQLVEAGHVTMIENPAGHDFATVATVKSQTSEKTYHIMRLGRWEPNGRGWHKNHKYACTCYDYRAGNAPEFDGQPNCKHIAAASMQDYINTHDVMQQYLDSVPKQSALEPGEIVDVMNQSDARYKASAYAQRKREIFQMSRVFNSDTPEGAALREKMKKRALETPQPF